MDQSKAEDFHLRKMCLEAAIGCLKHPNADPLDVLENARDFYLFLSHQDPLLDVIGDDEAEDNVVSFREFVRNVMRDVSVVEMPNYDG